MEMVYRLKSLPKCESIVKPEDCRFVNEQEFNILKSKVGSPTPVIAELSRFFSDGVKACERDIK